MSTNETTGKKVRPPCTQCGAPMKGEHFAAKRCEACRSGKVSEGPIGPPGKQGVDGIPAPEETRAEKPQPLGEVIGTSIPFFLKPGDTISINLKQRPFVFFKGLRLTPSEWSAKIPEDISPEGLKALRLALEAGDIVKGEKYLPKYPKSDNTLPKFYDLLKRDIQTLRRELALLARAPGLIEGFSPLEIFRAMIKKESEGMHRKNYMDLLQIGIDHIDPKALTTNPIVNQDTDEVISV